MFVFLHEFVWVLFFLGLFALCGGFIVAPFARVIRYSIFMAPMAGLLIVVLGVSCFYSILNLSVLLSTTLTISACIILTIITLLSNSGKIWEMPLFLSLKNLKPIFRIAFILFILSFIGFLTYINCFSSIDVGSSAFLYSDGSDHLGYAHLADWLNAHLASNPPALNLSDMPNAVYQSWPVACWNDPRFGSFFTLAIIALLKNNSAMFSYDTASAIVLIISYLGLSAVFSRSFLTFSLLCLGLLTNYWFDYAQSGYLGKTLGYSSVLFVLGLFLVTKRPFSSKQIMALTTLTAMLAGMYPVVGSACFLLSIGGVFVLLNIFNKDLKENFLVLCFLLGETMVATGTLIKPIHLAGVYNETFSWQSLLPPLFDLERLGMHFSQFSNTVLLCLVIVFNIIALFFLIVALRKKEYISASLLTAPYILLSIFGFKEYYWVISQIVGIFYTCFLCASIRLIDTSFLSIKQRPNAKYFYIFFILYLLSVFLHIPRLYGAIERYAGSDRSTQLLFSQKEMNTLTNFSEGKKITIDVNSPMFAIPLLVEIGRKSPNSLQWSEKGWKAIVGYQPWSLPPLQATPYQLILNTEPVPTNCKVNYRTRQYCLLECQ